MTLTEVMSQDSPFSKWLVALALLSAMGCEDPPVTSTDIALCSHDDYLEDAPRDLARRDHENHTGSLAPFWPSPHEVVDCMLNLADVDENDVVVDLGSGDGRIVIAAAKRGARGIGIDYDNWPSSVSLISKMVQMFGWSNAEAALASWRKRRFAVSSRVR